MGVKPSPSPTESTIMTVPNITSLTGERSGMFSSVSSSSRYRLRALETFLMTECSANANH